MIEQVMTYIQDIIQAIVYLHRSDEKTYNTSDLSMNGWNIVPSEI